MKLLLDYNYTMHCKGNLLGYVGETDSRKITVEDYQTDGADLYKLRLSMPDKAEYEVDISNGEYIIPGSLLSTAGYVRLQVVAVRSISDGNYEYVKKSNVLSGIRIEESLDGTTEPVPTYEDAVEALDKVLAAVETSADNAATVLWSVTIAENARDIAVAKAEEISDSADQIQRNKSDIAELYNKADGIVCDVEGADIVITDSSELPFKGMRIFGRSTQDRTPSPDDPVPIISVGDSGVITVTVSEAEDQAQYMTLSTTDGLLGIPLNGGATGSSYTDENGKQWVCDEIDFKRGVYIRRIGSVILDGVAHTEKSHTLIGSTTRYIFTIDEPCTVNNRMSMCSALEWKYSYSSDTEHHYAQGNTLYIFIENQRLSEYKSIDEYLKEHPMEVIYQLAEAAETPLSEDKLSEYKSLHTYKPTTVITNSDKAHMAVDYTADTKAYIDNKFADVISAIVSTGGNV